MIEKCCQVRFSRLYQSGIGLIELMISMLIGLFIMAGVLQMFSTSSQNAVANAGISRIQENLRYSVSRIAEDIGQSGNMGCISASLNANGTFSGREPVENMLALETNPGEFYAFTEVVSGDESADGGTFPAGEVKTGSDTLRIRYVNHAVRIPVTAHNAATSFTVDAAGYADQYANLQQNQIVALANCSKAYIFMIANDPTTSAGAISYAAGSGTNQHNNPDMEAVLNGTSSKYSIPIDPAADSRAVSPTYLYAGSTGAYQYFIGTSVAAGNNGDNCNDRPEFCALYRRTDGNSEELAEGVHDMQVEYGWTDTAGVLRTGDADVVQAASAWNLIDRVKVTFSFNSIESTQGGGDRAATSNNLDAVFDKTLTRTFNLNNQI